jgi:long-chain acyl-CoA synthetase
MTSGEDLITADEAGTLDGLFSARVHRSPDAIAYRQFNKSRAEWQDLRWSDVAEQVSYWQQAMHNEGLQSGDRVALLMRNSADWGMAEQAALSLGLVTVPLYCDDRPDNIAYILQDSATRLLIANQSMWRRIQASCQDIASLQRIVIVPVDSESCTDSTDPRVKPTHHWLPESAGALPEHRNAPGGLATIVYTSGTTGRPKGVMLSHANILSIAHASLATYDIYPEDMFLSFLPLSHTFERTVGYYVPMMSGATVAYARSIAQLGNDLQQVRPTLMVAVPRIFERFHARILQQLEKKSFLARGLFRLTIATGWRRFESQQGRGKPLSRVFATLLWPLLDRLVAQKVRACMGGQLRIAVSGGAALPFTVARTMIGLGLTITQGYGLTETSPVISGNPLDDNDPTSVGVPLRGIELSIGDNDELLVKTPGMMLGYWNNHAATAEMIDADGWLHTGDQARIDNNHIYITGRIKDILVLSNGEKIPPGDMEAAIATDPLFEQVMVVGEGKPFLSAVAVLNGEEWIKLANQQVIDPYRHDSLQDPRIQRQVIAHIRKCLQAFPSYAKIRRVLLSLEPWTVDNGLLTPTLKVKRNKVLEIHAKAIQDLYT